MDMFLVSIFVAVPILGFAGGIFGKSPKQFDESEENPTEEHLVTKLNKKRKEGFRDSFKSTIDNYNKAKEIIESKKKKKNESVLEESKEDIDLLINEAQEEFKNGGTVSLREHMKKNEDKEEQK